MTVTALGEVEIGAAIPAVYATLTEGALADIEAKVEALAAFKPVPVDFAANIALVQQMIQGVPPTGLGLNFQVSLGPPSVEVQAQLHAAFVEKLRVLLEAGLAVQQALLASIHLYKFEGLVGSFGTEMQAALGSGLPGGSGSDPALALTLVATAEASQVAVKAIFKTE